MPENAEACSRFDLESAPEAIRPMLGELAKPEMQPGHRMFDRAKYDALEAEYRSAFG